MHKRHVIDYTTSTMKKNIVAELIEKLTKAESERRAYKQEVEQLKQNLLVAANDHDHDVQQLQKDDRMIAAFEKKGLELSVEVAEKSSTIFDFKK